MKTATKGNIAEGVVLGNLVEMGLHVLVPFGSGHPYDLVVDLPSGAFLRVQVKTGWTVPGCLIFNARSTDHGRGRVSYDDTADLFAVYYPPTREVFLLPVSEMPCVEGRLRLAPTKNNQRVGVRAARDFEIGAWSLARLEAVADQRVTRAAA